MATREELSIALAILRYLGNTQRDMRDNANAYLAELAAGRLPIVIGPRVTADGVAVSILMVKMGTFLSVPARQAKATAGLAFFGLLPGDVNADRLMIKDAADVQAGADVSTAQAITTAANATLAAIPAIDNLP